MASCSPAQDAAARSRFEAERARVRAGIEQAVQRMEEEGAELRAKLADQRSEASEQWQRALADLEARKALAKEKLRTLGEVGLDAWEELRAGFERAAEELQRASDHARKEPENESTDTR